MSILEYFNINNDFISINDILLISEPFIYKSIRPKSILPFSVFLSEVKLKVCNPL